jgi:uncharacterized membrane protein YhiD involved in acid resistance
MMMMSNRWRQKSVWSLTKDQEVDEEPYEVIKSSKMHCVVCIVFWVLLVLYTVVILFGDVWLLPKDETAWCRAAQNGYPLVKHYRNPDANSNPCHYERTLYLFGMNQFECMFAKRMIVSVLLGGTIGWERKAAERPAGVRTMSLVSLGSCFFTMCGQHAFRSSPQSFDAARVSAAIPSGVGFLGSALIWKHSTGAANEVHGLTTAASVWLSASVGIGAGGGLFILSSYCVVLVIFVLRIGPGIFFADDSESFGGDESETEEWDSTTDNEKGEEDEKIITRAEQRQLLEAQVSAQSMRTSTRSMQRRKSVSSLSRPVFGS